MESETVGNHSVFPCRYEQCTWGLTKREYIAAVALQGMLANPAIDGSEEDIAINAVEYAEALIKELNIIDRIEQQK